MKILLAGMTLALAAASAQAPQPPLTGPVTVYTNFIHTPPNAVLRTLKSEVANILEPSGFRTDWRALTEGSSREVSVELVVVTFNGNCDADAPMLAVREGPLGRTHTSDHEVLPFVDVDCGRIRTFLGSSLLSLEPAEQHYVLARAAARVLAHELFHVLANTRKHSSRGIAKSCHTIRELLAESFRFEEKDLELLRRGDAHRTLEHADTAAGGGL
jgi:hypothetical protein